MIDQVKFLEMLKEIMEVARVQDNTITKQELEGLMGDVKLSDEQLESVYAYLAENKIEVAGFVYTPPKAEIPEEEKISEEDSIFLKMYKEDLQEVERLDDNEKAALLKELLLGNEDVKERILNGYLHEVIKVVQKHKNKGVKVEDLIQEGNLGLMTALQNVPDSFDEDSDFLVTAIEDAIIAAIDENSEDSSSENTIVAKANLIREAAKYLEEDLGRAPGYAELSEYTKISKDEIRDILNLASGVRK